MSWTLPFQRFFCDGCMLIRIFSFGLPSVWPHSACPHSSMRTLPSPFSVSHRPSGLGSAGFIGSTFGSLAATWVAAGLLSAVVGKDKRATGLRSSAAVGCASALGSFLGAALVGTLCGTAATAATGPAVVVAGLAVSGSVVRLALPDGFSFSDI